MESSSENSFAWTDTSSDSFDSNAMVVDDTNGKSDKNSCHNNNYGKKRKEKKLSSKTSLDDESEDEAKLDIKEEQSYCDTESNSNIKKKRIKLEPESDIDLPKKKKKIKHIENNGTQNDSNNCGSYDESYIHMKVKQEESSAKQKQIKRKQQSSADSTISAQMKSSKDYIKNSSSDSYDGTVTLKQEIEHETKSSKSKKKKKKSKVQYDSDDHSLEMEVKMDIGETDVNKPVQINEIVGRNTLTNYTVGPGPENNTSQEEEDTEESGSDEISAIKCDDNHNLHTISFINNTTEEVSTKNHCNDSLSETIISSLHRVSKNRVSEQNITEKCEATNQRKPRISDRIQFEDEEDTNMVFSQVHESDNQSSKKSSKMNHFAKANPNLKLLTQKLNNNSSLTLDDEIWILKCPKDIDIKAFNNTSLKIHGKCKIKVSGQTYDGSAEEEQSDKAFLTMEDSKYKIHNLPLSGMINLRKRIPKPHFRDDNIMVNNQTNFIPLPETKCRHPLFGSNYKKALKIPAAIAERLNEQGNEETLMKTEKRKKKKHKKDKNTSEQVDPQIQSELIMKTETGLSQEVSEKKRKKRKLAADEGPAPKKVKRIKHDPESAEAWESEKAIEENLFNF